MAKEKCGFEKAGGQRVPTSSGKQTAYRGPKLQSSMYGKTPSSAIDPRPDVKPAGSRQAHRLGERD